MRPFFLATLFLVTLSTLFLSSSNAVNIDPECACNLTNLWLDVVVVLDNSLGMTQDGLTKVTANLATVFAQSQISQNLGQYTRVGVVTYNENAQTQFELTYFNDTFVFIDEVLKIGQQPVTSDKSYISAGLAKAHDVMDLGRANGLRNNVRQVIIVYASDYDPNQPDDPVQAANAVKEASIDLIVVTFNQENNQDVLSKLAKLATAGMAFDNADVDLVGEIQQNGLCQANCFCPTRWEQYTAAYKRPGARRFGSCLQLATIASMWVAARIACQGLHPTSYLVTEFDEAKHNFTYNFVKNDNTTNAPYIYHIGLSYDLSKQAWMWEQYANQDKLYLGNSSYSAWNPGEPKPTPTSNPCVVNQQLAPDANPGWSSGNCYSVSELYVCEMGSCDTDRYCP